MPVTDDYMSAHDVSLRLDMDRSYVLALCRQGRFTGAAKIGTSWAIPIEAVENFQRLKPGVKSKTKLQREEDKSLIARTLEELKGSVSDGTTGKANA